MNADILLKNTSRSLYLSARMLPERIRHAFSTAYLLCRYADTIADSTLLAKERRLHWIERFPSILIDQNKQEIAEITKELSGKAQYLSEEDLLKNLAECISLFNQLEPWQKVYTREVVRFVCEGMRIDLIYFPEEKSKRLRAFARDEDLKKYCHLMGGAPGIFWSQLIYNTVDVPAAKDRFCSLGRNIGDALQIVNILRDITKDLRIGRCYFPQADLEEAGLSPNDLLNRGNMELFEPVRNKWIQWGLEKILSAKDFYAAIPLIAVRERMSVAMPIFWTLDTFYKIYQERDLLNDNKKVKISKSTIYLTMALCPLYLVSNKFFNWWLDKKIKKFTS